MKKLIPAILLLAFVGIASTGLMAQKKAKPFNGTITYGISYPDSKLDPAALSAQPTETKVIVVGNKSKSEMVIQGMVYITSITNGDTRSSTTLIDAGGQKIYYKLTEEEIKAQSDEEGEPVTAFLEETKEIAGYTCNKATVTTKDSYGDSQTITVFYSPALGGKELNFDGSFRDIPGLPLYYEIKQGEQLIVFEAKEIKKGKFKETEFLIPDDFRELTAEEKQQLMDAMKGE